MVAYIYIRGNSLVSGGKRENFKMVVTGWDSYGRRVFAQLELIWP